MTKTGRTRRKLRSTAEQEPDGVLNLVKRAHRRRAVRDGARELAAAIASLSQDVTLDLAREPFVTEPPDLFELTFHAVGLGAAQMPLLREQLKQMLPEIAAELDDNGGVLDQPDHRIESYAAFIRVALLMKVR